jgi:hypothetical protein
LLFLWLAQSVLAEVRAVTQVDPDRLFLQVEQIVLVVGHRRQIGGERQELVDPGIADDLQLRQVRRILPVSERRTCRVLGQHRSTRRHPPRDDTDEQRLTADIVALAKDYGRYGYRRIHALLGHAGWQVSLSVVERIWRREGLKVPKKQPKHPCPPSISHPDLCRSRRGTLGQRERFFRMTWGGTSNMLRLFSSA